MIYKWFRYNGHSYNERTKLIYNGTAHESYNTSINIVNEEVIFIKRFHVGYKNSIYSFLYNGKLYSCDEKEFLNGIVSIGVDSNNKKNLPSKGKIMQDLNDNKPVTQEYCNSSEKEEEIIWDDWMVAKTLWYIVVMAVGVLFNARIGIWIAATYFWWKTTIKNAPRA